MTDTDSICGCPFCSELECGYLKFRDYNLGNRIVWETKNFVVFPAIDELVDGYLLIATKQHFIGMGDMPPNFYTELHFVQKCVQKVLRENYETPIFFEHGPATANRRGGCCIEHAHIHAVPVKINILDELRKRFICREINSYEDLKNKFHRGEPYFLLKKMTAKNT